MMKNYSKAIQKIKSIEKEMERNDKKIKEYTDKNKELEKTLSIYKPLIKKMNLIEKQFEDLLNSVEQKQINNEEN